MARPTTLYHFTRRVYWQCIEKEGITRGECPITSRKILNYPNLTTRKDTYRQKWASTATGKMAVRITVEVPPDDDLLVPYEDLAKLFGATDDYIRLMFKSGRARPGDFWIYKGTVEPSMFRAVDFFDAGVMHPEDKRILTMFEDSGFDNLGKFMQWYSSEAQKAAGVAPIVLNP